MSNPYPITVASLSAVDDKTPVSQIPLQVGVPELSPVPSNSVGEVTCDPAVVAAAQAAAKKRKIAEDPHGHQESVCGLHLDQLLCNNTKYTVFDWCELCLDEGVRCRIGKHPNLSSSGLAMAPYSTAAQEDMNPPPAKHFSNKGKKKNLPSGYRFYFIDQRDLLLQTDPRLTFAELSPMIAKSWGEADESVRQKYKKMAEVKRNEIIQEAIASQGKKVRMVSAFQFYTREQRALMKEVNPGITFAELSSTISKNWAMVDESAKQKYRKMADEANMAAKHSGRA